MEAFEVLVLFKYDEVHDRCEPLWSDRHCKHYHEMMGESTVLLQ